MGPESTQGLTLTLWLTSLQGSETTGIIAKTDATDVPPEEL